GFSPPARTGQAATPAVLPQAYFHVFPSLHCLNRADMERQQPFTSVRGEPAGFGIKYLDDMLGNPDGTGGLPLDVPAALIGEDGTYKSRLGRAFLSRCFAGEEDDWGVAVLLSTRVIEHQELADRCMAHLSRSRKDIA